MIFRGEELPPPRHALDGDFEDDANVKVSHSLSIPHEIKSKKALMLLAPRVSYLIAELGGAKISEIQLQTTLSYEESAATSDLYDLADEKVNTTMREWRLPVFTAQDLDLTIILAPALPESEAAFTGREIINRLMPACLWAASPCVTFDARVSVLWTSVASYGGKLPPTRPPTIVQGVVAAAVSRCELKKIPAVTFLIAGDGPAGHEVTAPSDIVILRQGLLEALGIIHTSDSLLAGGLSTLYV